MANTNSADVINSSQVDHPQPAIQAEGEAAFRPSSPIAEPATRAGAEAAPGSSPTAEAGSPGPSPVILNESLSPSSSSSLAQPVQPTQFPKELPGYPLPWYTPYHRDYNPNPQAPDDFDESQPIRWKELYEKVDQFDKEFFDGWISEIDSIPTFAGLLAAVVTAFVIESYKLLQPDPQQMTNQTLLVISAQLAGKLNTTEPPSFTPSPPSLRINLLWFLSLTCTLMAGLVAILCKQWLRQYRRRDFSLPHKEALAFRQLRYEGILQWKVTGILSALPMLLALALILFFIGLIDFLHGLRVKLISIPVTILIGIGFAFLAVTTSAPAFQYVIARYSRHSSNSARPRLFAFKSPQSLAILHLAAWLFPPLAGFKPPDWTSWELTSFFNDVTIQAYTEHALAWIHETYSYSLDIVHQICLCLQDTEVKNTGKSDPMLQFLARGKIKSLFDTNLSAIITDQAESYDIISMRYLSLSGALEAMSFDQIFTILERSIHTLNSSHRQVSSFQAFRPAFIQLSIKASKNVRGLERFKEMVRRRAMLFQKLLSEKRWTGSTGIPAEVRHVFEDLTIFADNDLDSILNAVRAWILNQHPQDVGPLSSHCWITVISQLKPHEFGEALQRRPVHDFMAFLDSRFQMSDGVEYLCRSDLWFYGEKEFDSFFKALYAWIERNPQNMQSFANCQTLLATMDSQNLDRVRQYQPFNGFEAFLEKQRLIRQRAILFRDRLSKGQWGNPAEILTEVGNVSKNLKMFSNEDLSSIFEAICTWMDQHPQDAGLPSRCWVSIYWAYPWNPRELEVAHRLRPPVRDFTTFLSSRLQIGDTVEHFCATKGHRNDSLWHGASGLFFEWLYLWIERNPQDTHSFIHCRTLLTNMNPQILGEARRHQPFRDFETFLEVQIARDEDGIERDPHPEIT